MKHCNIHNNKHISTEADLEGLRDRDVGILRPQRYTIHKILKL